MLFNFFILKLVIEMDGNISLRYFSDEIYLFYQFETFYITMDYIIGFIAIFVFSYFDFFFYEQIMKYAKPCFGGLCGAQKTL